MTDGGFTMIEAWNLQLQARLRRYEAALRRIENAESGYELEQCPKIAREALSLLPLPDSVTDIHSYEPGEK